VLPPARPVDEPDVAGVGDFLGHNAIVYEYQGSVNGLRCKVDGRREDKGKSEEKHLAGGKAKAKGISKKVKVKKNIWPTAEGERQQQ